MTNRTVITSLVTGCAVVWAALLLLEGAPVPSTFFDPLSKVAAALVLALTAFDKLLWRLFPRSWVKVPNIAGTWEVDLQSNWIDPTTGQVVGVIEGFLIVRQTYSTVQARLVTKESQSHQLAASLIRAGGDEDHSLVAVYRNEPKILLRNKSAIHFGALVLQVPSPSETTLYGEYWTDRTTCGQLSGRNKQRKRFSTFGEAEAHWAKNGLRTSPLLASVQRKSEE